MFTLDPVEYYRKKCERDFLRFVGAAMKTLGVTQLDIRHAELHDSDQIEVIEHPEGFYRFNGVFEIWPDTKG